MLCLLQKETAANVYLDGCISIHHAISFPLPMTGKIQSLGELAELTVSCVVELIW